MRHLSRLVRVVTALLGCLVLIIVAGCQSKEAPNELSVGVIAGPGVQIMQVAKRIAKEKYGIDIKIVPFTDYTMPNVALANGSIDANMFQTVAYLNADIKERGLKLSIAGKTFIYPMAIYSNKLKNIKDTPEGAIVAIPNDPSNESRALSLLQKAGLIEMKPGAGIFATTAQIESNPKHLVFKQLEAAQLPRVLQDVTMAAINSNYAISSGLVKTHKPIFVEGNVAPYANVIVVRTSDLNNPKVKDLVKALHSKAVVKEAKKLYEGLAIPAWKTQKN